MVDGDQADRLKRKLYDAAIDLFCSQGYEATSLRSIAKSAGVSIKVLYEYYPTKRALLRQFSIENILSVGDYAKSLSDDIPLEEKFVKIMEYDYRQMFCLFDMSFVLIAVKEDSENSDYDAYHNFIVTESFYYDTIAYEQRKRGIEAGVSTRLASSILMGIYRQAVDFYRFSHHNKFAEESFHAMIICRLDAIWPSIEDVISQEMDDTFGDALEPLPITEEFMELYRTSQPFKWFE